MEITEGTNLSTQVSISVKLEVRSGNLVLSAVIMILNELCQDMYIHLCIVTVYSAVLLKFSHKVLH